MCLNRKCEAIVSSHQDAEATKVAIRLLPAQWRERGKFRAKSTAERAMNLILTNPIFTAKLIEEKLEVSTPAAMRAVKQLVDTGIVRERTGFMRNRVFAAEEVIEILARDYGRPVRDAVGIARQLMPARSSP